jgi:UDP-glucose 4-epimerase
MSSRRTKRVPVVITGGSGFLGKHIVKALLEARTGPITIIDRHVPAKELSGKVDFYKGDFSDAKLLKKALKPGCVVIHLAGTSNQATAEKDPLRDVEVSIVGTLRLLNASVEKKISKFIFMSSAPAVYGEAKKLPVGVDVLPNPRSAYGAMKLAIEHYVRHYAAKYGFSYVIFRSANAYGPGQFAMTHGVVSKFAHKILTGETIEIWGSPEMKRDFIFVEDLARAVVAATKPSVKDVLLNLATGRGTTFRELVQAVEAASGLKAKVQVKSMRLIDVPDLFFSIAETRRVLSWRPQVSLKAGVSETVQWIREEVLAKG